jgi:DNA-binding transcriptional ArsR family regulator
LSQPRLVAPELTKALSHPTRSHLLSILFERVASPKEMAQELDRSIRHVTYHLGVLEDLGCVELVRVEPAVGGRVVQHFYKAVKRAWLDRESWDQLDAEDQQGITSTLMEMISADIQEAMSGGTLSDPPTNHISRTPMTVDQDGWDEVVALLSSTLDELLEIQTRVANRGTPDTATMQTKIEIIHFRSPDRGERSSDRG